MGRPKVVDYSLHEMGICFMQVLCFLCVTANTDYVPITQDVIFQPGLSQQYVQILILSDEILEDTEQFVVFLSTNDTDVSLQNTSVAVFIESADGMKTVSCSIQVYA